MNKILTIFTFVIITNLYAQEIHLIDSIKQVLPSQLDSLKIHSYNELFWLYLNDDKTNALNVAEKMLPIAIKTQYHPGEIQAHINKGIVFYDNGRYEDAGIEYKKAITLSILYNEQYMLAKATDELGLVYVRKGDYAKALRLQLSALRMYEKLGKNIAGIASNIAKGYYNGNNMDKACEYMKLAFEHAQKEKNYNLYKTAFGNYCAMLNEKGDYNGAIKNYLNAIHNAKQKNDTNALALFYNNIGEPYEKIGDLKTAKKYYEMGVYMGERSSKKIDLPMYYLNAGTANYTANNYKQAENYLVKGLNLAKEQEDNYILIDAYYRLYELYKKLHLDTKAFEYLELYAELKNQTFTKESSLQIAEMQTQYETEKKDLEINNKTLALDKATLEISRKRTQILILFISILSVIVFSYLFYNRYKLRQKLLLDAEIIHQQEFRSKAIIEAEEKERIRIAKDLHDGIGQQLSAVKINLSAYDSSLQDENTEQKEKLKNLMDMVDDSVKELRSISHNMIPNVLIRYGLTTAVKEFINKISSTDTFKIDLQIVGINDRLESKVETVLYRVLQECISNIIKHAKASEVSIQLIRHDSSLNLLLEDNGVGFDASMVNDFEGIGLKNIISRVNYLNGTIDFDSTPGKGTTVIIDIPLSKT
jgi:two-component system NarL family sensor kinase